jgi:hypothetical protein
MKKAVLVAIGLLAAATALAGSGRSVPLTADDIAGSLGLNASAYEFAFDKPVYCKLTFELKDPDYPDPKVHSITSVEPAKAVRVSYCFVRPSDVASALGLPSGGQPNSRYRFSILAAGQDSPSGMTVAYADPLTGEGGFSGIGDKIQSTDVALDTDFLIQAECGPLPQDNPAPLKTEAEYMAYPRCVLIKVRFSASPFK